MIKDTFQFITGHQPPDLKVLVVDDHPGTSLILTRILSSLGCEVETADCGLSALEKYKKYHFDLMTLDWNMPHYGGQETLKLFDTYASQRPMDDNNLGFILCSGLDHRTIVPPPVKHLKMLDFWEKSCGWKNIEFQAKITIQQFQKGVL